MRRKLGKHVGLLLVLLGISGAKQVFGAGKPPSGPTTQSIIHDTEKDIEGPEKADYDAKKTYLSAHIKYLNVLLKTYDDETKKLQGLKNREGVLDLLDKIKTREEDINREIGDLQAQVKSVDVLIDAIAKHEMVGKFTVDVCKGDFYEIFINGKSVGIFPINTQIGDTVNIKPGDLIFVRLRSHCVFTSSRGVIVKFLIDGQVDPIVFDNPKLLNDMPITKISNQDYNKSPFESHLPDQEYHILIYRVPGE